ncbi:membrane protein [Gordonia phage Amore2]|uniref:Uncharacterized protein n=1 Tax=Gordonia phage GMA7 TaxID=1647286 RepID=A0A0K0N744_9CAUD|nr:hypothetical protein AU104_gp084 [Gordonia phage GMA7]AKJ72471.1 hypothetical protein GMA7_34 [Gordonia phage GMA7]USH44859.1 membrane protein [Gordonia phage Amore2]
MNHTQTLVCIGVAVVVLDALLFVIKRKSNQEVDNVNGD